MQIRRAEERDLNRILEGAKLFCEHINTSDHGLDFDRTNALPFFRMMIHSPMFVIFVAEQDEVILGSVGASLVPWFCNTSRYLVDELFWFVFPEARGGMIGPRLFKRIEQFAKDSGASVLAVSVMLAGDESEKVERFYQKRSLFPYEKKYLKKMED